jgi:hypothetical protein
MTTKAQLDAGAAKAAESKPAAAGKPAAGGRADRTKDPLYGNFAAPGIIAGHFTTAEAAQRVGIHKSRLDQMARWNDPRVAGHVKAGLTRLFPIDVVKRYFESDRKPGPKTALQAEAAAAPPREDQPALPGLADAAKPAGKKRPGGTTIRPSGGKGGKGGKGGPKPVKGKPKPIPKPIPKPSPNGHVRPSKAKAKKKLAAAGKAG